ncbi:conserved hypothetical protein [Ricinus communis]|uniref:Uncharacterized protein n=1 Tax=Ricinus communis TaxID=3988 RepID=B9S6F9_RICCO|nr:conserved hypothetical protein [Ricinus communis]
MTGLPFYNHNFTMKHVFSVFFFAFTSHNPSSSSSFRDLHILRPAVRGDLKFSGGFLPTQISFIGRKCFMT